MDMLGKNVVVVELSHVGGDFRYALESVSIEPEVIIIQIQENVSAKKQ